MDVARRMLRYFAVSVVVCVSAFGLDVEQFVISQAHVQVSVPPPRITVYLDTLDAKAQPVMTLRPSDLSGTVGAHPLKLESIKAFESSGEGVAYVFLIDVSGSIGPSQFLQMTKAISIWIDELGPSDRVAIFAFGDDFRMISDFTANKNALSEALASLAPKDTKTLLHNTLVQAMELNSRGDAGLPARRVIVVLSDGKDEGSGFTVEDVLVEIRQVHMPIYAIGYSRLPRSERQKCLDVMNRFAVNSGGVYRDAGAEPLKDIYADIRHTIRRVWIADFNCPECEGDNRPNTLHVSFTGADGRELSSDAEIRIPPFSKPITSLPIPWWGRWWVYAGAAVLVAALALVAIFAGRQKKPEEPKPEWPKSEGPRMALRLPEADHVPAPPEPAGLRLKLAVVKGKNPGKTHELQLTKRAVIGRKPECDVVLKDDDEVSGCHAELALVDGKVVVYDLQSQNGTSVNGVPIVNRYRLETGDSILVGQTEFRITIQDAL